MSNLGVRVFTSLCPALLSAAAFWPSRHGAFVYDDSKAIVSNKDVLGETPWWQMFQHDFWGQNMSSRISHKSYRPLTTWTFRLNFLLLGSDSFYYHYVNIILFSLLCFILYFFISALCQMFFHGVSEVFITRIATLSCTIFALHPVHTESVAGVVGRADILSLLCSLLWIHLFLNLCKHKIDFFRVKFLLQFTLLLLLAIVATCCKEQGLVTPLIGLLASIFLPPSRILKCANSRCSRVAVCLLIFVIITFFRLTVMHFDAPKFSTFDNPHAAINDLTLKWINRFHIWWLHLCILVFPIWHCYDWSMGCVMSIAGFTDIRILSTLIILLINAMIGMLTLDALEIIEITWLPLAYSRFMAFLCWFGILSFLPSSNLFVTVGFVVAERALFWPSLPFSILVALLFMTLYGIRRAYLFKMLIASLVGGLLCLSFSTCFSRCAMWCSEEDLYKNALHVCPLNAKIHYNVANIYSQKSNLKMAIQFYESAITLEPNYDEALNNLANLYREHLNKNVEAERLLERAVLVRPDYAFAWMNLGVTQLDLQKPLSAEKSYLRALQIQPHYPNCLYNLGVLYHSVGKIDKAVENWKIALQQDPLHKASRHAINVVLPNHRFH